MFGAEFDAIYEDGEVSEDERTTLSAMIVDEEAQFVAIVDPIYDACAGVEELYAGAFAYRDVADWALKDAPAISREDSKKIFIVTHCHRNEARPACLDFVADDWR